MLLTSILCVLLGTILPIGLSPYHQPMFAIIVPAVFLVLLQNTSPKRAAWFGWLFGLGYFTAGVGWVYISVHHFGKAPIPLAIFITGLFIAYLALFTSLFGYLIQRFSPRATPERLFLVFPSLWVLLEWLRSWLFTGFHWLQIGYSQVDQPLGGFAPIIGVYGLSWLCAITGAALIAPRYLTKRACYWGYGLVSSLWIAGALLHSVNWTHPTNDQLKISMVQGNIPQAMKWHPEELLNIVKRYHQLTIDHWDSDLIIWPEAAMPMLLENAQIYLEGLNNLASKNNATVMLGVPIRDDETYYNGLILVGENQGRYEKRHILPFAEFTPLEWIFKPLSDALNIPMSDFASGEKNQTPIHVNHIELAPFICYEIAEPDEVRRSTGSDGILVTITDDSWFDGSIAADQHLQMARMRSLELGRWQVFVASRGITAVINNKGQLTATLPMYKTDVLTDTVPATAGFTPWHYFGSWPVMIGALILLLFGFRRQYYMKGNRDEFQKELSSPLG